MTALFAQASSAVSCAESGVLLLVMFGVFWFMYIRPQMKEQQKHKSWIAGLKKGDEVVTQGGLIGKVHAVAADIVTLELARDVRVRVMKAQVQGPHKEAPAAPAADAAAEPAKEAGKPEEASPLAKITGWLRGAKGDKPPEEVKK